jgi:drug/metabolite transporter (DMT)-like permease
MTTRRTELLAVGALVLCGVLFGTSFVVVKHGLRHVDPIPYVGLRFALATVVFWPIARRRPAVPGDIRAGVGAGLSYAIAMVAQSTGLQHTTASTSAFLTYLLVVIVPVISFVITRVAPPKRVVLAIAIAVGGLTLLTGGGVGFGKGEIFTLVGAVVFGYHIIQVGRIGHRFDLWRFNAAHCATTALVTLPLLPFTGGLPRTGGAWLVIVYAALVVTCCTLVPWTWAARHLSPTRTALILLTEPVFAALADVTTGGHLSGLELTGAALILVGAIVSESAGFLTGESGVPSTASSTI